MSKELKDLLVCEKFMGEVIKCGTDNEIFEKFSKEGIELSSEELGAIKKLYREVAKDVKEMNPDEIEKVSGGADEQHIIKIKGWTSLIAPIIGGVVGAASGAKNAWDSTKIYESNEENPKLSIANKISKIAYKTILGAGAGIGGGTAISALAGGLEFKLSSS
ncbi:MAG: hypothetical protein LBK29_01755 [Oscillospiraceae bacterium]|jgi:hypothetical protein|nr:hypothetical protein [Oscillospiraceae bacterium]